MTKSRNKSSKTQSSDQKLNIINAKAAVIDLVAREHWVCVPQELSQEKIRSFGCTTPDLLLLADWLEECGITSVAMESTGVEWIPLFQILSERQFKVFLVNAKSVKNVPGRKSDVLDCQWLQQLHS